MRDLLVDLDQSCIEAFALREPVMQVMQYTRNALPLTRLSY